MIDTEALDTILGDSSFGSIHLTINSDKNGMLNGYIMADHVKLFETSGASTLDVLTEIGNSCRMWIDG